MTEAKRCTRVDFAEIPGGQPLEQPSANGAMVALDKKAYVFGGYANSGSHAQVAEYDLTTKQWAQLPPLPAPRSEATAVVLGADVVLFGGWDDKATVADTLVAKAAALAEGKANVWQPLAAAQAALQADAAPDADGEAPTAGAAPEPGPRRMHTMTPYHAEGAAPCAYMFGGFSESRLNDLWRFDSATLSWSLVECQGFIPSPRDSAVLAADPEKGMLLLFGGYTSCRVNELFVFDIETATWSRQPTQLPPSARFGSLGTVLGGQLIVGFGQDARGASASFFTLKLSEWKWSVTPLEGDELEPRINFSWCTADAGKRVVVAGGSTNMRQCTSVQEIELEKIEAVAGGPGAKKK